MKAKLLFGAGMAAGFVLGARSGRAAYEKIKTKATGIWDSKPVQDTVTAAAEAVKDKAPDVTDQLAEAARRAGTVISSTLHRDDDGNGTRGSGTGTASSSAAPDTAGSADTAGAAGTAGDPEASIPAHSTHPETVNLGTADVHGEPDIVSDPALSDEHGQEWSSEGGATPEGAATNTDPDKAG